MFLAVFLKYYEDPAQLRDSLIDDGYFGLSMF
ncbi:Putative protein [Zobellia galactanivorans]|uniref:Uncharacterized protein n=1 Tax=Zobellia galactanivorans (strain DSM 12802 / CCUG 47099 / CIP 106680 / NCIMB 13871 / Dsij) TaxID=63186 RepID=G0L4B3_ZOBGA|nr:Putative protein [Zobellia galactanivorans]